MIDILQFEQKMERKIPIEGNECTGCGAPKMLILVEDRGGTLYLKCCGRKTKVDGKTIHSPCTSMAEEVYSGKGR